MSNGSDYRPGSTTAVGTLTSSAAQKGDLWGYSTDVTRIASGSDEQVLTADSAETTGVKWASLTYTPSVGLVAYKKSGTALPQTVTGGYTGGNYDTITGLTQDVTVNQGERIWVQVRIQALPASAGTCVARSIVKIGTGSYFIHQHSATEQIDMNLGGSVLSDVLAAGTYTVRTEVGRHPNYANVVVGAATSPWTDMDIIVLRGGYSLT